MDIEPLSEIKQAPYDILIPYKSLIKGSKIFLPRNTRICPGAQSSCKPSAQIPMRLQSIIKAPTAQDLCQRQTWMFKDLRLRHCWTLVVVLIIVVVGWVSAAHHNVDCIWGGKDIYCGS